MATKLPEVFSTVALRTSGKNIQLQYNSRVLTFVQESSHTLRELKSGAVYSLIKGGLAKRTTKVIGKKEVVGPPPAPQVIPARKPAPRPLHIQIRVYGGSRTTISEIGREKHFRIGQDGRMYTRTELRAGTRLTIAHTSTDDPIETLALIAASYQKTYIPHHRPSVLSTIRPRRGEISARWSERPPYDSSTYVLGHNAAPGAVCII